MNKMAKRVRFSVSVERFAQTEFSDGSIICEKQTTDNGVPIWRECTMREASLVEYSQWFDIPHDVK